MEPPPALPAAARPLPKYMQPDPVDLAPTVRNRPRTQISSSLSPHEEEKRQQSGHAPSRRERTRTQSSTTHVTRTGDGPRSRTKVDKACVYCKRSHMTCEAARPCQRCIKRGIPELCRDDQSGHRGRPKGSLNMPKGSEGDSGALTKPIHDNDGNNDSWTVEPSNRKRARSSGTTPSDDLRSVRDGTQMEPAGHFPDLPESESRRPDGLMELGLGDGSSLSQSHGQSTGQDATHASSSREPWSTRETRVHDGGGRGVTDHSPSHIPNVRQFTDDPVWGLPDHPDQHERLLAQVDHLMAMNARAPIDDNLELLGWLVEPDAALAAAAAPPSPPQNNLKTAPAMTADSAEQSHHGSQPYVQPLPLWPQPSNVREPKNEEEDLLLPWNYTYSYAKINRYISRHWNKASIDRVTRVVSVLRPHYLSILHDRTDIELIAQTRTLQSVTRRIEDATNAFSPCPTLIWRRTGEIVGANTLMADLLEIPKAKLSSNSTLAVYELLEEDSAVRMFEDYAQCCYPAMSRVTHCEGFTTTVNSKYTIDMPSHAKSLRKPGIDTSSCMQRAATIECATSMMTYMDAFGVPVVVVCSFTPLTGHWNGGHVERSD